MNEVKMRVHVPFVFVISVRKSERKKGERIARFMN